MLGEDADDALRRAREAVAAGTGALIAVGGDGLMSLALQAVAGTSTPLGVVAVGTGNDFARALGLPIRDPAAAGRLAARALKDGGHREIDLGRVGGRWFGTVLASGFDSRVNDRGNRMRLVGGRFKYDLAILAELAAFKPIPYRIRLDGERPARSRRRSSRWATGPRTAGACGSAPRAEMDDGLFDVTVVGECTRTELLKVFPKVYKGAHLTHPAVTVHRVSSIELVASGVTAYADGEPMGPLPLTATCVPGAVRVLTGR